MKIINTIRKVPQWLQEICGALAVFWLVTNHLANIVCELSKMRPSISNRDMMRAFNYQTMGFVFLFAFLGLCAAPLAIILRGSKKEGTAVIIWEAICFICFYCSHH